MEQKDLKNRDLLAQTKWATMGALVLATMFSLGDIAAWAVTADACIACHGPNGNSVVPTIPRLAGQYAIYLEKELKAFKTKTRKSPDAETMYATAANLDDATMHQLAEYFATQQPTPNTAFGNESLISQGKQYYIYGAQGVIACASCHGQKAEGQGRYPYPRLAGQNKDYLMRQLKAFRDKARPESNVMSTLVENLTDTEAEAIAVYLQSVK